jgi:hypothetical protein
MKLLFPLLGALLLLSTAALAADITGNWEVTISHTAPDGTLDKDTGIASLQQKGDVVTGSVGPDETRLTPISEGTVKDNKIIIKLSPRPERTMTFELTLIGEKLIGIVTRTGENQVANAEFVRSVKK